MATLFNLGSVGVGLPHAENTGLVISDTAKLRFISFLATFSYYFFSFSSTEYSSQDTKRLLSLRI
jgi:hypothetical protein